MKRLRLSVYLGMLLSVSVSGAVVDVKTVSVNNGSLTDSPIANRFFLASGAGAVSANRVPVGTAIWFVADVDGDGIRTSPTAATVLDPGDDLVLHAGVIAGPNSSTAGRYVHEGLTLPDTLGAANKPIADVDIYVVVWNGATSGFTPVTGSTFGVVRLGKTTFPSGGLGNGFWGISENLFVDQYTVGGGGGQNRTPVLDPIAELSVDEGTRLETVVRATDPDAGQTLSYSLVGTVPQGVTLDSVSGRLEWIPTELQGPGRFEVKVRATDDGIPPAFDEKTFSVVVREVNGAPVLAAIPDRKVTVGETVSITVFGQDFDLPAQELVYGVFSAPVGVAIDRVTGRLTWTPTAADVGIRTIGIRVTDNGQPAMSAEREAKVEVVALPVEAPVVGVKVIEGKVRLEWVAAPGVRYVVESRGTVGEGAWAASAELTFGSGVGFFEDAVSSEGRYYRVLIP